MSGYLCQKSVEFGGVLKKHIELVLHGIGEYEVQKKYDGCQAIFQFFDADDPSKDCVVSRTGEDNIALRPALRELRCDLQELIEEYGGLVLFAEAYKTGEEFRKISGDFRRQKEDHDFEVKVFDTVTLDEFNGGHSDREYYRRMSPVFDYCPHNNCWRVVMPEGIVSDFIDNVAEQSEVEKHLTLLANKFVSSGGYDGIILRDPYAGWDMGDGKNGVSIKVKPLISLDLIVKRQELGTGKLAKLMGKVFVEYNGKEIGVGTGFNNAERAENWVGRMIQVDAMSVTADGSLREPRFVGERFDKVQPD